MSRFMVEKALGDRNETVRKHMLQASVTAINDHGKVRRITLLVQSVADTFGTWETSVISVLHILFPKKVGLGVAKMLL